MINLNEYSGPNTNFVNEIIAYVYGKQIGEALRTCWISRDPVLLCYGAQLAFDHEHLVASRQLRIRAIREISKNTSQHEERIRSFLSDLGQKLNASEK